MIMWKDICKYQKILKRYLQQIDIDEQGLKVNDAFRRISKVLEILNKKEEMVDRYVKEATFAYKMGQNSYRPIPSEEEKIVSKEISLFNWNNIFSDCKIVQDYIGGEAEEYLSSIDLIAHNCLKQIKEWLEDEWKLQVLNKEINKYVKNWNEGKNNAK